MSDVVINFPFMLNPSDIVLFGGNSPITSGVHPKMTITLEGKTTGITVPYAPVAVTHTNIASEWNEIQRSGRDPLLVKMNDPRPHMAFQLFFGHAQHGRRSETVDPQLKRLAAYARNKKRVKVKYATWENGLWRISSMSITSVRRNFHNAISQATVDIEFILASDVSKYLGPASGGVKGGVKNQPAYYIVKKGDTLHSIAVKFYRDASMWKEIAKKNKIKDPRPRKALKVGRKILLPKIHSTGIG